MFDKRLALTADIVSAYVGRNSLPAAELPRLIAEVNAAVALLEAPQADVEVKPKPAVSIKSSVTPDYIICLEDGKRFKSLRRHLNSSFNMSPEEYRAKWALPSDYPMVAPNYATARSEMAKRLGLGRKPGEKRAAKKRSA